MAKNREPTDNHAIFFRSPLGQFVIPCVMVDRAGGYHLDIVTTGGEPERSLTADCLCAPEHARAKAGRYERQLHQ